MSSCPNSTQFLMWARSGWVLPLRLELSSESEVLQLAVFHGLLAAGMTCTSLLCTMYTPFEGYSGSCRRSADCMMGKYFTVGNFLATSLTVSK